ncbi:Parvovirus non-structural protein 1 helicase domain [Trinorchestia longiramus]|nr:Parvovirus non-structural protein 1 helicase domain [Trinorchestia longiramus]
MDMVVKNNIQQVTEVESKLNEKDWVSYSIIPGNERLLQACIDRVNYHRLEFERLARTDAWHWYDIALVNLFKSEMPVEEKNFVETQSREYYIAGYKLLREIFESSRIDVMKFWFDVANVLECKVNKKNTLYLVGTTDAGKTTISKMLSQGFLRAMIGQAGNASQFIFQDIPNKSLIVIEEAIFAINTVDDFKNVLGGETNFAVNVKNKKNQRITVRTPVITTSNRPPWMEWCACHDETFRNRGFLHVGFGGGFSGKRGGVGTGVGLLAGGVGGRASHNVNFVKVPGASPVLIYFNKFDQEVERVQLKSLNREQCNDLLLQKGFFKKNNKDDPVPEEYLEGPYNGERKEEL